jgi:hypothetical protein
MPHYRDYPAQSGAGLLTVLVFLEIFTLLSLYSLRASLWNSQTTQEYWQNNQLYAASEKFLADTEHEFSQSDFSCHISPVPAAVLPLQPLSWWQSQACAGKINFFQYYFVIEDLGVDACALLLPDQNAHYYRITLLTTMTVRPGEKILLQSTIITPRRRLRVCAETPHDVRAGRQSSRLLI